VCPTFLSPLSCFALNPELEIVLPGDDFFLNGRWSDPSSVGCSSVDSVTLLTQRSKHWGPRFHFPPPPSPRGDAFLLDLNYLFSRRVTACFARLFGECYSFPLLCPLTLGPPFPLICSFPWQQLDWEIGAWARIPGLFRNIVVHLGGTAPFPAAVSISTCFAAAVLPKN